jgi:hypothetical protein
MPPFGKSKPGPPRLDQNNKNKTRPLRLRPLLPPNLGIFHVTFVRERPRRSSIRRDHGLEDRPERALWGATPPTFVRVFPGPPGPARPQTRTQKSGQTAFMFPFKTMPAGNRMSIVSRRRRVHPRTAGIAKSQNWHPAACRARNGIRIPGYLKAVWPGCLGVRFRGLAGPGGPGTPVKHSKMWGAKAPTFWKVFPSPRGRPPRPHLLAPPVSQFACKSLIGKPHKVIGPAKATHQCAKPLNGKYCSPTR